MFKENDIIWSCATLCMALLTFSSIALMASASGIGFPTSAETGLTDRSIYDILSGILGWLLRVIGIVALIGFVISGGQYILSSGDEKMKETGKRNMTYCIIGIIVVLGSFVIIQAIDTMLEGAYDLW